jgi:hypothetical protein
MIFTAIRMCALRFLAAPEVIYSESTDDDSAWNVPQECVSDEELPESFRMDLRGPVVLLRAA